MVDVTRPAATAASPQGDADPQQDDANPQHDDDSPQQELASLGLPQGFGSKKRPQACGDGTSSVSSTQRRRLNAAAAAAAAASSVSFEADPGAPSSYEEALARKRIPTGIRSHHNVFDETALAGLEKRIDELVLTPRERFAPKTMDRTSMRTKYFFGYGYTYGVQCAGALEQVYPTGLVDPIPDWARAELVAPLERAGVLPAEWANSMVVNDYAAGGFIVSHIDPPHIFERPIVSLSLFSDGALAFGCAFSWPRAKPGAAARWAPPAVTEPWHVHALPRGAVTELSGFAADRVPHAVRPCDTAARRVSIILRRVRADAPVYEEAGCALAAR